MSGNMAISVENLSKCYHIYEKPSDRFKQMLFGAREQFYREFWAVKDLSFEVKKGETIGIVGQNGSGKSTLLQMICGTLNPTSGSVKVNGRISALLELGSGFNPEFTGKENVYLNASILGLTSSEIEARYDEILAFADIGSFIDQPVKTYSSGMYVRLAFAVNAMVDPDIFVVDEALAVGDEKFQRKCFLRLEKLKEYGSSIIFVSHSSEIISQLCQKTLLLNQGRRLMFAPPPDVLSAYQRLLYAPVATQENLIEEIIATDSLVSYQSTETSPDQNIIDIRKTIENSQKQDLEVKDAFDPNLVPETTITFPAQGAIIDSFQISNIREEVVNVLVPGNTYTFSLSGRFLSDFSGIHFGIHIKSVTGVAITGQHFPEVGSYIENVSAGQSFRIDFLFKMNLLPGVYFVGGGIWSREEPNCLHRIFDSIMFRVSETKKVTSFCLVDLKAAVPVLKIWNDRDASDLTIRK